MYLGTRRSGGTDNELSQSSNIIFRDHHCGQRSHLLACLDSFSPGSQKSTWTVDQISLPRIKGAAVLTRRLVTLFDPVKEVKTGDVEKTGSDTAEEEVEEKEEVWMLPRKQRSTEQ